MREVIIRCIKREQELGNEAAVAILIDLGLDLGLDLTE